tara:strand:- start:695 stop:862 length:168 start_codon:yes stop_codon:yes gene_type:complete
LWRFDVLFDEFFPIIFTRLEPRAENTWKIFSNISNNLPENQPFGTGVIVRARKNK